MVYIYYPGQILIRWKESHTLVLFPPRCTVTMETDREQPHCAQRVRPVCSRVQRHRETRCGAAIQPSCRLRSWPRTHTAAVADNTAGRRGAMPVNEERDAGLQERPRWVFEEVDRWPVASECFSNLIFFFFCFLIAETAGSDSSKEQQLNEWQQMKTMMTWGSLSYCVTDWWSELWPLTELNYLL